MDCNESSDLFHFSINNDSFDWVVDTDLESESVLYDQILKRLFTDARHNDQRGWFGNEFLEHPIGSKLWTLKGKPINNDLLNDAARFSSDAVQPCVKMGLCKKITASATREGQTMQIELLITLNSGDLLTLGISK